MGVRPDSGQVGRPFGVLQGYVPGSRIAVTSAATSRASLRSPGGALPLPVGWREIVVAGLILTYLWRFQDLSGIFAPFRLAALLTLASWAYLAFQPNWPTFRAALSRPYAILFLAWTAWIGIGVPFALLPRYAWGFFSYTHFGNAMMFIFLLASIGMVRQYRVAAAAHCLGAAVIAAFYVKQGFPTLWTPLTGVDRNDLSLMLNTALPFMVYFAFTLDNAWYRRLAAAGAFLFATCIIFSQSRGGFLTLALLALFIGVRFPKMKVWHRVVPIVALVLGVAFAPPEVQDRLRTILETEEDYNVNDDLGRVQIWQRGLGYLMDSPITGVGVNNFVVAEGTLAVQSRMVRDWKASVAHNVFVEVGVETGFVGGFLYLAMIATALIRLFRLRSRLLRAGLDESWGMLADANFAAIAAFCTGGMFLSFGYSPFLFFLLAMAAGLERSAERALRTATPTPRRRKGRRVRRSGSGVILPAGVRRVDGHRSEVEGHGPVGPLIQIP